MHSAWFHLIELEMFWDWMDGRPLHCYEGCRDVTEEPDCHLELSVAEGVPAVRGSFGQTLREFSGWRFLRKQPFFMFCVLSVVSFWICSILFSTSKMHVTHFVVGFFESFDFTCIIQQIFSKPICAPPRLQNLVDFILSTLGAILHCSKIKAR